MIGDILKITPVVTVQMSYSLKQHFAEMVNVVMLRGIYDDDDDREWPL